MNYNSEVLYYQNNIGADPDFKNLKMTVAEALILIKKALGNNEVFSSIRNLNNEELLNNSDTKVKISEFESTMEYVEDNIFSKKAKELGYIVLENFEENFLCFSERKQEYVIWTWFFYDKGFGRGFYSFSLKEAFNKMEELKNG